MKRIALVAASLAAIFTSSDVARAQAAATPYVLDAVDAVEIRGSQLRVTGVVQGDAAPSTVVMDWSYFGTDRVALMQGCERKALLAMSRPGAYRLTLTQTYTSYLPVCALSRVTP
jgi:hypothetical protein